MKTLLAFIFVFTFGCEHSTQPLDRVEVAVRHGDLVIVNKGSRPIYHVVYEREILAVIDWGAYCGSGNMIAELDSSVTEILSDSFLPSNQAVVFWWSECDSSRRATNVTSLVIRVR